MPITYKNEKNSNRDIEPAFERARFKYRSTRHSQLENIESNSFKLDISKINSRIDNIETKFDTYLKYFNGDKLDINESSKLNDGLTYSVENVRVLIDDDSPSLEDLEIDTMDKISSRIFRLTKKISRLEKEV